MTEPGSSETDTTANSTTNQIGDEEADEWVEEDENYDDDDYDDGEEEAEEIARRLKEQLWADISKAQADRVNVPTTAPTPGAPLHDGVPSTAPSLVPITQPPSQSSTSPKKEEAALKTMMNVLNIAGKDPLVHSTLASAVVPGAGNSVLEILNHTVVAGTISKDLAKSLSMTLVSLARSDALFAALRHSNASALQLDKGKRKRDETEDEQQRNEARVFKRQNFAHGHLQSQITDAVRVVSETLASHPPSNGPPDPSIISSIQLQLHQIFLFAVTSSARGGPETNALQEISGLIQVVGVLSGSPIGPTAVPPNAHIQPPDISMYPPRPWIPPGTGPQPVPFSDIGTAVYPCLVPGCRKTFARLFNLRAHQQVHALHRPYRCVACPASFARNHDLKRHAKLHDKTGYQCAGCYKLFSRRDAIKRHKNSSAARGGKGEACVNAAIKEVELDKEGGDDALREANYGTFGDDWGPEEGEMDGNVIGHAQEAVLSLHKTLQAHVSSALGTTADHNISPMQVDPAAGQATLASVIARAQLQNMPSSHTQQDNSAVSAANPSTAELQPFPVDDGCCAPNNDYPAPTADSAIVSAPPLSLYGLSEEQARLLEQAIANAASAAQAQAEAEAALEEQEEDYEEDCDEDDGDNETEIRSTVETEIPSTLGP
ncbi:uncharacterized protein EDB93DRAFT_1328257 [Suillus bovinus]|uniref:uncharacterized protein n=1 Tax=Suillus bovinus TaxID=48563 RepID=UPI001B86055B|nr:uncharacterized protein EDB93DRAFT_1328257 [Suillus bovinus]KAG2148692.1 hypothetical protein EDB93DRAFT_1328257 [Suillus bovinus]